MKKALCLLLTLLLCTCLATASAASGWTCRCGTNSSGSICTSCQTKLNDLLDEVKAAKDEVDAGNFAFAINRMIELRFFDSMEKNTAFGNHFNAAAYSTSLYIDWAEYLLAQGTDPVKVIPLLQFAGDEKALARIDKIHYDDAVAKMEAGNFDEAEQIFKDLGAYGDAKDMITEVSHRRGLSALKDGQYDAAIEHLSKNKTYKDASTQISESYYLKGKALFEAGKMDEATEALTLAGNYKDAQEMIATIADQRLGSYLSQAEEQMKKGLYEEALTLYTTIREETDVTEKINECNYQLGCKYLEANNREQAEVYFALVPGYKDTDEKVTALQLQLYEEDYNKAYLMIQTGNTDEALAVLKGMLTYDKAKDLYVSLMTEKARDLRSRNLFAQAISVYEDIASCTDVTVQIRETALEDLRFMVSNGQYDNAGAQLKKYQKTMELEEPVIFAPESEGSDVVAILQIAADCGYISSLPKSETGYKAKYEDAVKKLESHFGLTEDGQITLTEMIFYRSLLCPGADNARRILERLFDLGYITTPLDEVSKVYDRKYVNAVKKAEKELKLNVDGILTPEEKNAILTHAVTIPNSPKIKVSYSEKKIKVTWQAVPGVAYYEILDYHGEIYKTTKTSFTISDPNEGEWNSISVAACKYSKRSSWASDSIYVEPTYRSITIKDMVANRSKNLNRYFTITSGKPESYEWKGADVYVRAKNKGTVFYYKIGGYNNWSWNGASFISKYRSITSITIKGRYIGEYKSYPCIDCENLSWSY